MTWSFINTLNTHSTQTKKRKMVEPFREVTRFEASTIYLFLTMKTSLRRKIKVGEKSLTVTISRKTFTRRGQEEMNTCLRRVLK